MPPVSPAASSPSPADRPIQAEPTSLLQFEFEGALPRSSRRGGDKARSIREAILRWLDEQL